MCMLDSVIRGIAQPFTQGLPVDPKGIILARECSRTAARLHSSAATRFNGE